VAGAILTILAVRYVEKRVDTGSSLAIGRSMLIVTGLVSAALIGFAISPFLSLTIGLYLAIYILRSVAGPLQTAWVNQKLDSNVRATVHSMFGQVDAIGQVMGGPGVALIARFASVIAAISTSGLLLTPALFLIRRANRISTAEAGDTSKAEATPAD
jgi:DHA3 family tetracycline resistance protein-like MFS transporter